MSADRSPGGRARQRQRTRERFLDAALEVFDRVGYHDAKVEDILSVSGGGRATFYSHFTGKADIAAAVFERCMPMAFRDYERLDQLPEVTPERVRNWLCEMLRFWQEQRTAVDAINNAMADDPVIAVRHYAFVQRAADHLTTYLAPWQGPHREEGQLRAVLLILQLERFCWHWLVRGIHHDRDVALRVLTSTWCRELSLLRAGPA
jgi:AcrR family transcriptional regulator